MSIFANGTTIPAGGYLVVAKDNVTLKAKYPAISASIIGNFSGSLANSSDVIALNDQRELLIRSIMTLGDGTKPLMVVVRV